MKLSEELLVSVCSDDNHVRTWSVTRFRGMISTQPGSTSIASFKIMSLEEVDSSASLGLRGTEAVGAQSARRTVAQTAADCGPFGDQDDQQVRANRIL